ncbi:MAG: GAF domain-containing protein [Rhodobacterales bacterium]|nr:GAF domain-containing protein [Rhodobacterales bacterium]
MDEHEQHRIETLELYDIIDTASEDSFDKLVKLAALVCEMPISLVSLVDEDRQWFKARVGLVPQETSREIAFCNHAIQQDDIFIVADAQKDSRFATNPLVTLDPNIRFYAGAPLKMKNGQNIGTLCVIGKEASTLSPTQLEALSTIRDSVVTLIEFRRSVKRLSLLKSLLPVCAWCQSVSLKNGEWQPLMEYIQNGTPVSHEICPSCDSRNHE